MTFSYTMIQLFNDRSLPPVPVRVETSLSYKRPSTILLQYCVTNSSLLFHHRSTKMKIHKIQHKHESLKIQSPSKHFVNAWLCVTTFLNPNEQYLKARVVKEILYICMGFSRVACLYVGTTCIVYTTLYFIVHCILYKNLQIIVNTIYFCSIYVLS